MTMPSASAPVVAATLLRPLRWWDIPAVARLEALLFPSDSPWSAAMFWSELAAGNHYIVACDAEGVILGYAGLATSADDADVQTIGVAPANQGRGIGRALFDDLVRAADGRTMHLEVRCDNAAAIALYESEGFERVGVRRRYYQPSGADAYSMLRPGRSDEIPTKRECS